MHGGSVDVKAVGEINRSNEILHKCTINKYFKIIIQD